MKLNLQLFDLKDTFNRSFWASEDLGGVSFTAPGHQQGNCIWSLLKRSWDVVTRVRQKVTNYT